MTRIKISIRLMMIATACIAAATWWLSPLTTSTIVQTADRMDVAIDGSGYFRVLDEENAETRYTRTGRCEIDQDNKLNIRIDERIWPIDPPITVPSDTRQLDVSQDGNVRAHTSAGPQIIGRFQIAHFSSASPFDRPFLTNTANDRSGFEDVREPSKEDGWLIQGFIERAPPDARTIAAVYAIAILVSCVLTCLARLVGNYLGPV